MAIQSFYISIEISEENKKTIVSTTDLKKYKKSDDLMYKGVLYIDNVSTEGNWWHVSVGLYDLFHSCEMLYKFCREIETVKPNFDFYLLGQKYKFDFKSILDFFLFIYPKIEKSKSDFEEQYGALSVSPHRFFTFYKRNKHFFR